MIIINILNSLYF